MITFSIGVLLQIKQNLYRYRFEELFYQVETIRIHICWELWLLNKILALDHVASNSSYFKCTQQTLFLSCYKQCLGKIIHNVELSWTKSLLILKQEFYSAFQNCVVKLPLTNKPEHRLFNRYCYLFNLSEFRYFPFALMFLSVIITTISSNFSYPLPPTFTYNSRGDTVAIKRSP